MSGRLLFGLVVIFWCQTWMLNAALGCLSIGADNNFYFSNVCSGSSSDEMKEVKTKVFLNGINQPWVNYGYDFGNNGDNSKNFKSTYCQLNDTLSKISGNNGNSIRVWIHGSGENSPLFDENGFVIDTDRDNTLINDMRSYLQLAKQFNVFVFFVLWNGAIEMNENVKGLFDSSNGKLESYIDNCLSKMIYQLSNETSLGGWEIINEPELSVKILKNNNSCYDTVSLNNTGAGSGNNSILMNEMQYFISRQSNVIHDINRNALVTVGSWSELSGTDMYGYTNYWKDECLLQSNNYTYLNGILDFYQWHSFPNNDYTKNHFNKHSPFNNIHSNEYDLTKPIIIGEFDTFINMAMDAANETAYYNNDYNESEFLSVNEMYAMVYENGFNGAWAWNWQSNLDGMLAINDSQSNNKSKDNGGGTIKIEFGNDLEKSLFVAKFECVSSDGHVYVDTQTRESSQSSIINVLEHMVQHICVLDVVFAIAMLYLWVICYKYYHHGGCNDNINIGSETRLDKHMIFVGILQYCMLGLIIVYIVLSGKYYYNFDQFNKSHDKNHRFFMIIDAMKLIPLYTALYQLSGLLVPPMVTKVFWEIERFVKNKLFSQIYWQMEKDEKMMERMVNEDDNNEKGNEVGIEIEMDSLGNDESNSLNDNSNDNSNKSSNDGMNSLVACESGNESGSDDNSSGENVCSVESLTMGTGSSGGSVPSDDNDGDDAAGVSGVKHIACQSGNGIVNGPLTMAPMSENNIVIFRWITRGLSPQLMLSNLSINWNILKKYENRIKIEIVTDKKMEGFEKECEKLMIPNDCFDQIVVSDDFETPNNTKFKARGLYYASKHSYFGNLEEYINSSYIFHCDEESIVTESLLNGIFNFISSKDTYGMIGQGLCVYKNEEFTFGSYLSHMADNARIFDDLGRMRGQFHWFNSVLFGFKGSFVLCPNYIEIESSTSYDVCGVRGSITEDAWWALNIVEKGYKFAWCDGILIEQSPFSVFDFIKQRKRWMSGLILTMIHHNSCSLKRKIIFISQMIVWILLPIICVIIWFRNVFYIDFMTIFSRLMDNNGNDIIDALNMIEFLLFLSFYILGHLLNIHKSYFEKIVLIPLLIFLIPIFVSMEAIGVMMGVLFRDNNAFNLIQKEGSNITVKTSKNEDDTLDEMI